jgi:hypothetical protein
MPNRLPTRPFRSLFLTTSITLLLMEVVARSVLASMGLSLPKATQEIER